jgi:hypothetical protein
MITVSQILKLAMEALSNNDFETFSAKFAELFYDIENTGEPDAIKLAHQIESKLADVSTGITSERSLENFLLSKFPVNTQTLVLVASPFDSFSAVPHALFPSNQWAVAASALALEGVDIPHAVEYGSQALLPHTHQTSMGLPR